MKIFLQKNKYKILLLAVLVLAVFLRAYNIESIPPGIYQDEAANANDAIEILSSEDLEIFYTDNNGREGLFINLIALSFYFFGVGIWQLKLPSILIGILTILGTYILTKEIFKKSRFEENSEMIALLSPFFIATSFWHINFSRIAFRGILTPLILTFGSLFLLIGIRRKKAYFFALSGAVFGLGIYSYPALQLAPIAALFAFLYFFIKNKKNLSGPQIKKYFLNIFVFFFIFFLAATPALVEFQKDKKAVSQRYEQLSVLSSEKPIYDISKNTLLTLGEFNIKGDCNPRHNYNCQPQLFWLVGIFFIFGMAYFIKHRGHVPFTVTLFYFFAMLIPAILTNEGVPHALRSIGSLVPAYILAAFGAFWIFNAITKKEDAWKADQRYEKYLKQLHRLRKEIIFLAFLLLIFSGYVQAYTYFNSWRFSPETANEFGQKYSQIAAKINDLPKEDKKYIIVNTNGVWVDNVPIQAETIKFLARDQKNINYLRDDELRKISPKKDAVIIPLKQDVESFRKIQRTFPSGKILLIDNIIFYRIN